MNLIHFACDRLIIQCIYFKSGRVRPHGHLRLFIDWRNRKLNLTTTTGKNTAVTRPQTMADQLVGDCVDAFKSGNKQVAEKLLPSTKPADVRTTFQSLRFVGGTVVAMVSLLHLAAYWGWKDITILLVAVHNCVPNWRDDDGHISLHYAAYNGHLEVVEYFITEQHCDPMDKNKYGRRPLHIACENGHLNIIQYLVSEAQCNPSCVDNSGYTPLHIAIPISRACIVKKFR